MKNENDARSFKIISTNKTKYPYQGKSQIGIYDKTILCEICERKIEKYDDYACRILLQNFEEQNYISDPSNRKVSYKLSIIDYKKLKLFFISVLWRALASNRKEFSNIKDCDLENRLKTMIENDYPGNESDFPVITTRFDDWLGKKFGHLDPHYESIEGIKFCRFYLGAGYKIFIKVDEKPLPKSEMWQFFILKPNHPLYIIIYNFLNSKEMPLLQEIIKGRNYL
jgi:hypothetical protein